MPFVSEFKPREIIINEFNAPAPADVIINGEVKSRGRIPRDWASEPFGSRIGSSRVDIPLIPRSEWTARIEELEKTKTRLSDLEAQNPFKSLDQNGTNYCWCNGVVTALTFIRARAGMKFELLSPASVAAQVKNFSNSGGWGGEALEFMVSNGITTVDRWPANAIKRQYLTEDNKVDAKKRQVTEWYELEGRNFDELMTLLINRIPVAVGYNWWSHEVCAIDAVVTGTNKFGIRIRNSWSDSYGDRGYNILEESRARPDDAVAPRVIEATAA